MGHTKPGFHGANIKRVVNPLNLTQTSWNSGALGSSPSARDFSKAQNPPPGVVFL